MGYYAAAARQAGVREPWVEDAAADIAIRVWLAPDSVSWKTVAHRAAIDAARHYRRGPQYVELTSDVPAPDDPERDALMRERFGLVIKQVRALPPSFKRPLIRNVMKRLGAKGRANTNTEDVMAYKARQRLRAAC